MKYFELFRLKPLLNLDPALLEKQFHQLSRRHHPDYHANSSPQERADALETTALLNDAYRTLRDPTRRAEYLVKSQGFTIDGSKVPKEMLMEVFEINEGLAELRAARTSGESIGSRRDEVETFRGQIADKRQAYDEQLQQAFAEWDALVSADAPELDRSAHLQKLADIISRSSYIRNLERELEDEVSH
jgi:molecular chaperone HscB